MQSNIIIEYKPGAGYLEARKEIERIFEPKDKDAVIDLLMPGWIGVKTDLDAKDIIEDVKDRFSTNPEYVKATKRWIPVDHWCTLETLPSTVKEEYGEILTDKDRCFIDLEAHNADIDKAGTIKAISEVIGAKLDDAPVDKILRIDVFPKAVAIARVKRHSIFQSA